MTTINNHVYLHRRTRDNRRTYDDWSPEARAAAAEARRRHSQAAAEHDTAATAHHSAAKEGGDAHHQAFARSQSALRASQSADKSDKGSPRSQKHEDARNGAHYESERADAKAQSVVAGKAPYKGKSGKADGARKTAEAHEAAAQHHRAAAETLSD